MAAETHMAEITPDEACIAIGAAGYGAYLERDAVESGPLGIGLTYHRAAARQYGRRLLDTEHTCLGSTFRGQDPCAHN